LIRGILKYATALLIWSLTFIVITLSLYVTCEGNRFYETQFKARQEQQTAGGVYKILVAMIK
jgi:hypothetical protein